MGHVTITTPLSGMICRRCAGTSYDSAVYQIWNLYVHSLRRYGVRGRIGSRMCSIEWLCFRWPWVTLNSPNHPNFYLLIKLRGQCDMVDFA